MLVRADPVAFDRDEVGQQSGSNFAPVGEVEDASVSGGGGDQHMIRSHPGAAHRIHLQPVLSVRIDANVAAHADRNAGFHRRPEGAAAFLDAFRGRLLAVPVLEIAGIGFGGGEGGAEGDLLLRHQPEHVLVSARAMLDRVRAGEDGPPHALGGLGVDGDEAARVVRRRDGRIELSLRKRGPVRLSLPVRKVRVQLDEVCSAADLLADSANDLVDSADFLRALRNGNAGFEASRAVGVAGDDRFGRDEQARAGDDVLVDRLAKSDIGVAGTLGSKVALGREARGKRPPRVDYGSRGAERQRLVQDLVVPELLIVGVKEQMRVALDQPGHERCAGKVDDAGAARRGNRRSHGANAIAVNHDRPALVRHRVHAVEQARRAQQQRIGERRSRDENGDEEQDQAAHRHSLCPKRR